METFGTGRGPIQSVASVHFSHRPPERENRSVAPEGRDRPEFEIGDPAVTRMAAEGVRGEENTPVLLPALIPEASLSPYTTLPFAVQQIAQETPFFPAASGPHQHRDGVSAYARAEASFALSPLVLSPSVRA